MTRLLSKNSRKKSDREAKQLDSVPNPINVKERKEGKEKLRQQREIKDTNKQLKNQINKLDSKLSLALKAISESKKGLDTKQKFIKSLLFQDTILKYHEAEERDDTEENLENARMHYELGTAYRKQQMYVESMKLLKQAVALSHNRLVISKTPTEIVAAFNVLAQTAYNNGNFDDALEYYQKSLEITMRVHNNDNHPDVAKIFTKIANVYHNQGKYDAALMYNVNALEIQGMNFGSDSLNVAKTYNNMGNVYNSQGKYSKAMEYYNKALEIKTRLLGNNHADIADTYNNVASLHAKMGDCDRAMEYHKKALEILQSGDHQHLVYCFEGMANVYCMQGKYEQALDYYQQSLDTLSVSKNNNNKRERRKADELQVAKTYNNMANVYDNQGHYDKAMEYYEKSLQMKLKKLGNQHPDIAKAYYNIANVHVNQNKCINKAHEYYKKALKIKKATLGEYHPDLTYSYEGLANVFRKKGMHEKALEYHKLALEVGFSTTTSTTNDDSDHSDNDYSNNEPHPNVARTYNNMANVYDDQGQYEKALEFYNKSLEIKIKRVGRHHPTLGITYGNMARVHREQEEFKKALKYHQQCMELYTALFGEDHPYTQRERRSTDVTIWKMNKKMVKQS